jgi:hypothetical protein
MRRAVRREPRGSPAPLPTSLEFCFEWEAGYPVSGQWLGYDRWVASALNAAMHTTDRDLHFVAGSQRYTIVSTTGSALASAPDTGGLIQFNEATRMQRAVRRRRLFPRRSAAGVPSTDLPTPVSSREEEEYKAATQWQDYEDDAECPVCLISMAPSGASGAAGATPSVSTGPDAPAPVTTIPPPSKRAKLPTSSPPSRAASGAATSGSTGSGGAVPALPRRGACSHSHQIRQTHRGRPGPTCPTAICSGWRAQ